MDSRTTAGITNESVVEIELTLNGEPGPVAIDSPHHLSVAMPAGDSA
jgi:hypothetical protein